MPTPWEITFEITFILRNIYFTIFVHVNIFVNYFWVILRIPLVFSFPLLTLAMSIIHK